MAINSNDIETAEFSYTESSVLNGKQTFKVGNSSMILKVIG